MEYIQLWDT